jgi:hypothetical protein
MLRAGLLAILGLAVAHIHSDERQGAPPADHGGRHLLWPSYEAAKDYTQLWGASAERVGAGGCSPHADRFRTPHPHFRR